jgi:hypothetical protein
LTSRLSGVIVFVRGSYYLIVFYNLNRLLTRSGARHHFWIARAAAGRGVG